MLRENKFLVITLLLILSIHPQTICLLNIPTTVEQAMTQGGDDRIIIPTNAQWNKYFTAPRQDNKVISRSSSTSSSTSPQSFNAARNFFQHLCATAETGNAEAYLTQKMRCIRQRIKHFWGSGSKNEFHVITAPSGTDTEMLPAFAALARHPHWHPSTPITKPLVTNVVVGSGEVGSGTILASGLRHFSKTTPRGHCTSLSQPIEEVSPHAVKVVEIDIRDAYGAIIPFDIIEAKITAILQKAIVDDGQIAVLHMVHACKTGLGAPREDFVHKIKSKYKDTLIIVVDAAQLRMNEEIVHAWLNDGYWVSLTGSKFLGGPSFSGAIFIPEHDAQLLARVPQNYIPSGLSEYFSPDDYDPLFINLNIRTPRWHNIGLALRWEAALHVAEKFCRINQEQRDRGIIVWSRGVRSMVREAPHLQLLEELVDCGNQPFDSFIGKCNSIVSFGICINDAKMKHRFLNLSELRKVHEYLTQDLQHKMPLLSIEENSIAATSCLIGQPVQIGTKGKCTAVLRIAIGAPQLLQAIGQERLDPAVLIDELLEDDRIIIQKLELIAMHWTELSS